MKKFMLMLCFFFLSSPVVFSQDALTILPNGNVGIGTGTPSEKLEVSGDVKTTGRLIDKTGFVAPVGSIVIWPLEIPPEGWMECNGALLSRMTYADLFNTIGTRYGIGDGTTTFKLPDMRGMFVRGWDHSKGEDPDLSRRSPPAGGTMGSGDHVGTVQPDAFKQHFHGGMEIYPEFSRYASGSSGASPRWATKNSGSTDPEGTSIDETRPENIAMMFIIKY
jgi:phage-related tail fiber protein